MYGMVNKALRGVIVRDYGDDVWEEILEAADLDEDGFISNQSYPDEVTYNLVGAASERLEVDAAELLRAFGRYWILVVAREGYGELLSEAGNSLVEFLQFLPRFHDRVKLIFPELKPPSFRCSDVEKQSLKLHYSTHRPGLSPFVEGLLEGLGEMYSTRVEVKLVSASNDSRIDEVYHVEW